MNEIFTYPEKMWEGYLEEYLGYLDFAAASNDTLGHVSQHMRACDYLFVSPFFINIIKGLENDYSVGCLVNDSYEFYLCDAHKVPNLGTWSWSRMLLKAYKGDGDTDDVIRLITGVLRSLRPKVIFLKHDSLFVERAIITAARQLGIPTVMVQHGIFTKVSPIRLWGGTWVDHIMTWGDYFTDYFVRTGISEKVYTLGYPRKAGIFEPKPPESVCLLGGASNEIIEAVRKACKKTKLKLVYRPHPGETRRPLKGVDVGPSGDNLYNAIKEHDIFIALMSTALIEAAIGGRIALQVAHSDHAADDLQVVAGLYTVPATVHHIRQFLKEVKRGTYGAKTPNSNYVLYEEDIIPRFLELTETIIDGQ